MGIFGKQEAEGVTVGDLNLSCSVCGNDRFRHRRAQLNTRLATFFDFDWANRRADCYVCSQCGHIEWFLS